MPAPHPQILILASLLALLQTPARAEPATAFAGPPTQIMVLGTPHLSQFAKTLDPAWLTLLLGRLAATRPDIIAIEGISGEQCDQLRRYEPRYVDMYKDYCSKTDAAAGSTGLDVPAANAKADALLKSWPAAPTAAQRRTLAATFLAAGEPYSALVQWLRLPPEERVAHDSISPEMLAALEKSRASINENSAIGSVLAARLGHERVFAVDDHTADSIQTLAPPELGPRVQAIWKSDAAAKLYATMEAAGSSIKSPETLLAYYRLVNDPALQVQANSVDQAAAFKDPLPGHLGRHYGTWWEVRNLRMVANIRAAAGNQPGAKVLAIVGLSHKLPYERYLGMMTDVQLVSTDSLLSPPPAPPR